MKEVNITRTLIIFLLLLGGGVAECCGQATRIALPWVLTGYRSLTRRWLPDTVVKATPAMWREARRQLHADTDTLPAPEPIPESALPTLDDQLAGNANFDDAIKSYTPPYDEENPIGPALPEWLRYAIQRRNIEDDFMYAIMVRDPHYVAVAEWDLPIPPTLPGEDYSFLGYLRRQKLPRVDINKADISIHGTPGRINWLHTVNLSLQLSQAYISENWYQGGSDYLAFFGNFLWDVQLNGVYHPKTIFQSTLSYKLAINSTSQDKYHKYAISQELFQYNLKFGYQARHHWYYSLTTLFKTQFLNSYPADSEVRKASFLSPATLNLGVGMTYNKESLKGRLKFSASLSPVSYNLQICTDNLVDHAQFNMRPDQRTQNDFGSNAEVNFYWQFRDNIYYKTRLFLFTDYENFTGDWENTLNFQWSKLFSTQIYVYLRYDTGSDSTIAPKWKKLMMKEILSVGLSYNFSTKV